MGILFSVACVCICIFSIGIFRPDYCKTEIFLNGIFRPGSLVMQRNNRTTPYPPAATETQPGSEQPGGLPSSNYQQDQPRGAGGEPNNVELPPNGELDVNV